MVYKATLFVFYFNTKNKLKITITILHNFQLYNNQGTAILIGCFHNYRASNGGRNSCKKMCNITKTPKSFLSRIYSRKSAVFQPLCRSFHRPRKLNKKRKLLFAAPH